jgi:hypothetical protein
MIETARGGRPAVASLHRRGMLALRRFLSVLRPPWQSWSRMTTNRDNPLAVSKENPDERLRLELLRIAGSNYEEPEQKVHERSHAIAERLSLELPRLTDLARVPPDPGRRGRFRVAVLDVVFDAWQNDDVREAELQLRSTNAVLFHAMTALRSAKRALVDLDKNDREALWWPISEVERGIDRFFEWVLGEAERVRPKAHRRGRRAGTVKDRMFQIFVSDLLQAAEACSGKLGLEKNIGKGTLIEAIAILTPCLPKGFVPTPLPLSTLQRIKSKRTKRR